MKKQKMKTAVLVLGDLAVFYAGLVLTLLVRYGPGEFEKWWNLHLLPFSVIFVLWLMVFITAGLYNPLSFSDPRRLRELLIRAMLFAGAVSVVIFYFWSQAVITPKTNLFIDIAITALLFLLWRKIYSSALSILEKTKIAFFGWSEEVREISNTIQNNPHLGYEATAIILPENVSQTIQTNLPVFTLGDNLLESMRQKNIRLIVASFGSGADNNFIKMIYDALPLGIAYLNFPQFYEQITGRIPVSMIGEMWFLENITEAEKRAYEAIKRGFDIFAGILLGAVAMLLFPIVAAVIKIESAGPVFFRQQRVGKNGWVFELIKFRSKKHDDGWKNSGWNKEEDKKRTTVVGKILRKTYIDELPQALNIIKGEMSLIGPRPERPDFVEELKKQIPHYMMRLLARPGISGWAQINMRYDASAKDALEKLQYDLYYIKNRSFGLDLAIALKTLFTMLSRSGK